MSAHGTFVHGQDDRRPGLAAALAHFEAVASEIWTQLRVLGHRIETLPEGQRPPLMSMLLDFKALHLKLKRLAEAAEYDPAQAAEILDVAVRHEFELVQKIAGFAERVARFEREMMGDYSDGRAAPVPVAQPHGQAVVPALPPPAWHSAYPVPAQPGQPVHVYYVQPPEMPRPARRRHVDVAEAEEPDEPHAPAAPVSARPQWTGRGGVAGLCMMALSIVAGAITMGERVYRAPENAEVLAPLQSRLNGEAEPMSRYATPTEQRYASARAEAAERYARYEAEQASRLRSAAPIDPDPPAIEQRTVPAPRGLVTGASLAPSIPARSFDWQTVAVEPPKTKQPKETARAPTPKIISAAPPVMAAAPVMTSAAPTAAPPAPVVPVVAKAPPPPPAEPEPAVSDAGLFVPVLSTHKDAAAAREAFAKLQESHAALLGTKQAEVQTSGGSNGTWHRLVATPAMTKAAAAELCDRLRAEGYGRCWVKPY